MLREDIPNSKAETPIYKLIGILGVLVVMVAIAIPTSSSIANMYGPHFLVLYGCVITITLFVSYWLVQDSTKNQPLPLIPTAPDPYEIAYLNTGEIGVFEVAVIDLIQSGYLQVINKNLIKIAENRLDPSRLTLIQRQVYNWFSTPRRANEMYFLRSLTEVHLVCTVYQQHLQNEQLLNSDLKAKRWLISRIGACIILGLGGFKLVAALANGHHNVGFIIPMGILPVWVLWNIEMQIPRLSLRGKAYLKQLKETFWQLKQKVKTDLASELDYNLVVALFGITALAGTQYEYYQNKYYQKISSPNTVRTNRTRTTRTTKTTSSSSNSYSGGGCGGGCSSGSSCGSSCGGGCGGCGE